MDGRGVSIITCTKKPQFINNVFANYQNQNWGEKELIIILNRNDMSITQYKNIAKQYKNISVYQLPEDTSLGKCLNFAASKARYTYIAKFDDDDYYGPDYISDSMKVFYNTNADIVGKRSILTYIEDKKLLILRFPGQENKFHSFLAGGTIMFKRTVFAKVKFADLSLGEDVRFLSVCRARGFKIYSADRYNYVYFRRTNQQNHTWKTSMNYLLNTGKVIATTNNYKAYSARPKNG